MKVTLYKNCKLNNKYKDVFFNKTYLESYLSTLDKVVPLQDNDIFSREVDNLYIDDVNIPDFKQYNYIKIEDSIGTFYAFINNIRWINDVYQIFYEEDIMSNWFEYTHIRNSLLTGNKSLKLYKGSAKRDILLYKYPLQSESNDYIKVETLRANNIEPKIALIVKIQLYTLGLQSEPKDRIPLVIAVGLRNNITNITSFNLYDSMYNKIDAFINGIINKRGTENIIYKNISYTYDIDKIYAIPLDIVGYADIISPTDTFGKLFAYDANNDFMYFELYNSSNSGIYNSRTFTINYDRTIDSVGLLTRPIKIANNGTNIKIDFITYYKGYGFSVFMNVQNKIIDVTNDFLVEMPFTQASSSELQLKRLQLNLENNELNRQINQYNLSIEEGILKAEQSSLSRFLSPLESLLGGGDKSTGIASSIAGAMSDITTGFYNEQSKNIDINAAKYRLNSINRAIYSSSSIIVNKFSYVNALYGVTIFKIDEDNTTQINQAVKLSGFLVRELVNDVIQELDIDNLTDHYEIFKFDEVNIYGVISQEYIRFIERILLNGVRVWCQGNIGELV